MKDNLFSIGEIAEIKGFTVKALRFYEKIGLLKPHYIDPQSRYRFYHMNQFVYLDIIKAARTMSISPNALIPYFKNKDSAGLIQLLDHHKEKIHEKIRDLNNIVSEIDEVKHSIDDALLQGNNDKVYRRHIPDRTAVAIPYNSSKSQEEIMMDYSEIYQTIEKDELINTYVDGVIFSCDQSGAVHPEFICTFVVDVEKTEQFENIPDGEYICVRYTKINANKQQEKMWSYLKTHQLSIKAMVQVNLLTDLLTEEDSLFELQVRV